MIAMVAPRQSSPAKSPSNIGMTSSATPPSATQSWTASFTMLTAFNSPEKACESRTPAIKLLTPPQTPEPITMSVEAAAHDRAKYLLTIKRNERSPSREIAAHNQRNAQFARSIARERGLRPPCCALWLWLPLPRAPPARRSPSPSASRCRREENQQGAHKAIAAQQADLASLNRALIYNVAQHNVSPQLVAARCAAAAANRCLPASIRAARA